MRRALARVYTLLLIGFRLRFLNQLDIAIRVVYNSLFSFWNRIVHFEMNLRLWRIDSFTAAFGRSLLKDDVFDILSLLFFNDNLAGWLLDSQLGFLLATTE